MTDVLPPDRLLIDLRPEPLRARDSLEPLVPNWVRAVTMEQIEAGTHGLTSELGPLLVVCERGIRSGLAARFLRSDGLDAEAYPGGVPALLEALQRPGG